MSNVATQLATPRASFARERHVSCHAVDATTEVESGFCCLRWTALAANYERQLHLLVECSYVRANSSAGYAAAYRPRRVGSL